MGVDPDQAIKAAQEESARLASQTRPTVIRRSIFFGRIAALNEKLM
jgi:hypothetical protein